MHVHLNLTKTHDRWITWETCLDCKQRSPFANFHQEWYGCDSTCMRCGRRWSDGEWMPLNFCRNARADSKEGARRRWKRGLAPKTFPTNPPEA